RATAALRLELRCCAGAVLAGMGLRNLRFFLDGVNPLAHALYELILNKVDRVALVDRKHVKRPAHGVFPANCLRAVGFERDEGLLPYSERSFVGYRLLQEYFSFPRKFLFFDLCGFEKLPLNSFGERVDVLFFVGELQNRDRLTIVEQGLKAETFRLGCTPI